jgi:transposase-like protein
MSRSSISLSQIAKMFPDETSARTYMESRRWPNGTTCPTCGETKRIGMRSNGFYRCNPCKVDFTVRTGTIFGRSHIPLNKWLLTMYLLMTTREGISSLQLCKEIGVTQKSAWFMLGRLREACGNDPTVLHGVPEADETYIGGKHRSKKLHPSRGTASKIPEQGIRERGNIGARAPVRYRVSTTSISSLKSTRASRLAP